MNDEARLREIERLGRLLDDRFRIPGTGFRFGIDGLVGLVPGIGDAAMTALGAYLVLRAFQLGLPPGALIRMVGNLLIDGAVGAIPVVGDLFDIGFKANRRNVGIVRDHMLRRHQREAYRYGRASPRPA